MKPSIDNKELVFQAQSILKGFGYDVKTTHLHELFARLAGFRNIHEAAAARGSEVEGKSYFDREVRALEKYLASREDREPPFGDESFPEVLQFHSYVNHRFGLTMRYIQRQVVDCVVEKDQPSLFQATESTIRDGMARAQAWWDRMNEVDLASQRDWKPLTKEEYRSLKADFQALPDSEGIVEVVHGPNKGMIAALDGEKEGEAVIFPYYADGEVCLLVPFSVPFTDIRTISGEKVEF